MLERKIGWGDQDHEFSFLRSFSNVGGYLVCWTGEDGFVKLSQFASNTYDSFGAQYFKKVIQEFNDPMIGLEKYVRLVGIQDAFEEAFSGRRLGW